MNYDELLSEWKVFRRAPWKERSLFMNAKGLLKALVCMTYFSPWKQQMLTRTFSLKPLTPKNLLEQLLLNDLSAI